MVEILEAFASGDADAVADSFTEDADVRPSAFITGKPEFHCREEVRQGFAEMSGASARSGRGCGSTRSGSSWTAPRTRGSSRSAS